MNLMRKRRAIWPICCAEHRKSLCSVLSLSRHKRDGPTQSMSQFIRNSLDRDVLSSIEAVGRLIQSCDLSSATIQLVSQMPAVLLNAVARSRPSNQLDAGSALPSSRRLITFCSTALHSRIIERQVSRRPDLRCGQRQSLNCIRISIFFVILKSAEF